LWGFFGNILCTLGLTYYHFILLPFSKNHSHLLWNVKNTQSNQGDAAWRFSRRR